MLGANFKDFKHCLTVFSWTRATRWRSSIKTTQKPAFQTEMCLTRNRCILL